MKKLIIILLFVFFGVSLNAQLRTNHLFGNITKDDISALKTIKTANAGISLTYFLRGKISESAWEVPLFKGGGGQFFSSTGIGISVAGYDNNAIEKFSIDAIVYAPNENLNGVSTALTIGIPIPLLNLPNINVGIREDWKAKVTYLQTNVTIEF